MSCADKNPLTREGTSLLNRVLAALSTDYAKVDEREAADRILFAKRYAANLNFYNDNNTVDGDWQSLMSADVSVPLATLTRINVQEISDYKKRIYKNITLAATDTEAKEQFKFLFDLIFSVAKMVDQQFLLLPNDFEYKGMLVDVIKNKLQQPLANLEKCFNDFKTAGLLDYSTLQLDNDAPIAVVSEEHFSRAADMSISWQTDIANILITLPALGTPAEIIVYVINHNLFNAQIESLFNGVSSVVNRANDLFIQTLDNYPNHTPHFALFLSFLKIFSHAQDELNQYTQRHLDFYYKDVLRLTNQAPQPDSTHLLFELQKPVVNTLLLKNTLFKGGKDITGKEISYALTQDLVVNQAAIAKMHSTQIIRGTKDLLKASPIANSDDGQGAKITSADNSWFTFGDVKKIGNAQTGFAIASNILYLNEGSRTINVVVNFAAPIPALLFFNVNCFTAQFTGAKKWQSISSLSVSANIYSSQLTFRLTLSPDDPAIVPYSEKVHAQNMNIELPVLEIYLNQDVLNGIPYTLICNKPINNVEVSVNVTGVKDLVLSNDKGAIDASKPFKPFGDFPDIGAGFYIGSKEIFQKPLTQLDIITNWKTPSPPPALSGTTNYLWQNNFDTKLYAASISSSVISISFSGGNGMFVPAVVDFSNNQQITADSLAGFLRILINDSNYSLAQHLKDISSELSGGTNVKYDSGSSTYSFTIAPTSPPKDVILNNLSVNYAAATTITFDASTPSDNHLFYHLNPFGFLLVNNSLVDATSDIEKTQKITLLQDILNEGELFLGLSNTFGGMAVNILFEVADGSSNPLLDVENLGWYYLSANNNWKLFKNVNIIDNTNNFTQSGVVTITFPADVASENTLLENSLAWIKITAHPFADAVCKMVLIQAQAALVQLVQDDAQGIEFKQILPANAISKLVVSNGDIKKIQQPFNSFDGQIRERDDQFYVRISERLRHKQRASTIWDYEHIILQRFQKIFKVKCINHAGFFTQQGVDVFCENYPGHVSVITIPDLNNNTNVNTLRPYTPISLLNNISQYLDGISSPFAKIHVKNPQFEEVQLDFKVKFYAHLDESFFGAQLNTEIEQFLTPWAFGNKEEISFGGKIYKSTLINFVEERSYVDYVTCFKMYQFINRTDPPKDVEEAVGSTARSILVSYFDVDNNVKHIIEPIENCTC